MRAIAVAALLAWSSAAAAQDVVSLQAQKKVQEGYGNPSLTFLGGADVNLDARLSCGGKSFTLDGPIRAGQKRTMEITGLPRGSYACTGKLSVRQSDGSYGEMPLKLTVEILPVLGLAVAYEDLDLDARRMTVKATRPLSKASVDVIGEDGSVIGQGESAGNGTDTLFFGWQQPFGGEAIKLAVTGWDLDGLPGKLDLSPWAYDIPHEDVVFDTNEAVVEADEVPKLEQAWADLEAVRQKYGAIIEVKLFVAGYTDTVGDAGSNQALSERRARAIAQWFRDRGFAGEIHYQGFGESVLKVMTPDQTDEQANRRALYVLAAQTPRRSTDLPRGDWKRL